mgnify:CR=1 FL=1
MHGIMHLHPGFEEEAYSCKDWEDIYVPAHIQMEGYDAPQYANVQYPWEGHEELHPGQIPERFNPVASYVKYFHVPESMKGKKSICFIPGSRERTGSVAQWNLWDTVKILLLRQNLSLRNI